MIIEYMDIRHSREEDRPQLQRLYHHQHPNSNVDSLTTEVHHESQAFTAIEDNKVIGFAIISFLDYGLHPFGVIQELAFDDSTEAEQQTGHSLADACLDWLAARGALAVYATASSERERSFYQDAGFSGETGEMFRQVPIFAAPEIWA